jgi:hypothetical protein
VAVMPVAVIVGVIVPVIMRVIVAVVRRKVHHSDFTPGAGSADSASGVHWYNQQITPTNRLGKVSLTSRRRRFYHQTGTLKRIANLAGDRRRGRECRFP